MASSRICTIPDCGKPHRARGWCATHYAWYRAHGAPIIIRSNCSIEGCTRKHKNHGLCATHSWRLKTHGSTDAPPKRIIPELCSVDQCGEKHYSLGYCLRHYHKVRVSGTTAPLKRKNGALKQLVDKILADESSDDCIVPPGFPSNDYHYFRHDGVVHGAHRYVCEQTHGPAPLEKPHAAHSCGKSGCINPQHIRWASALENMQDKLMHGTQPFGEQLHHAKLKAADVLFIRSEAAGPPAEVARRFGIAVGTVHNIRRRRTWKHI